MSTTERKRRFARYVSVGRYDMTRLVWLARREGMQCIEAYKPGMCFWYEIALWGTSQQMRATEAAWLAEGRSRHEVAPKKPKGAFGIMPKRYRRESWMENRLPAVTDEPQGTEWAAEEEEA